MWSPISVCDYTMEASIRELKANLSGLIRKVEAGQSITVTVRRRPVARIVPIARSGSLQALARIPGIAWDGGKPTGVARAEALPRGVELAAWVAQDRR